ncbi:ImmA/IrrE family metallo-endopeptidase [Aquibacillus rhizosphaerae]|uniref:ImmA/IrrE family metallo-endopeptidase n=1 Tax=Aquibacillus rhizosphaerae TaxID=3051431 RepID=A0ABT7LA87_9BACI|nr:ImmA/IrrE family metallo-endopeptidase [Aquibacillus sp. LR5S19]MDL4842791.1 ImmA/IrrE family metallo-endopeptidase [Aquibacillus sp. LR5S19]
MLLSNYTTTALEDWVSNWYQRIGINNPKQINLKYIARYYDVFIHQKEMPARYDVFGRYQAITLDSRTSVIEQREQFFHEFAHILRHCGNQSMLPDAFRQLQEWDARHFTMYAALPYHMLHNYEWDNPCLIEDLAHDFRVSENLCLERIEKIKRNNSTNFHIETMYAKANEVME